MVMQEINASIGFDRKMWRQDIAGSLAHAAMLARGGIIAATDEVAIRAGLEGIAAEIESGRLAFSAIPRIAGFPHEAATPRAEPSQTSSSPTP